MGKYFLILMLIFTLSIMANGVIGTKAGEITASGVLNNDGKLSLKDHKGDVVLVEFWKTT